MPTPRAWAASQQDLQSQVVKWADQALRARQHQTAARALPWWKRAARRHHQHQADLARSTATTLWADLPDNPIGSVATQLILDAWTHAASNIAPARNPFHPSLTPRQSERANDISDQLSTSLLRATLPDRAAVETTDVPGLLEHLTPEMITATLHLEGRRRHQIAADPEMISDTGITATGQEETCIQHKASGLRALFILHADGFGSVYSKPYRIDSIDPENPGTCTGWRDYVGLGIGARIYQQATALHPHVRWKTSAVSTYSSAVRRKLHARDPYRWESTCDWCSERLLWQQADVVDFLSHP